VVLSQRHAIVPIGRWRAARVVTSAEVVRRVVEVERCALVVIAMLAAYSVSTLHPD
jgi:hypothetical protein